MGRAESRRLTGLWCNDSASLGVRFLGFCTAGTEVREEEHVTSIAAFLLFSLLTALKYRSREKILRLKLPPLLSRIYSYSHQRNRGDFPKNTSFIHHLQETVWIFR